jgi:hypothetical protein
VRPADPTCDLSTAHPRWWMRLVDVAVWPLGTGLCAGAAAAIGFAFANLVQGPPIRIGDESDATAMAWVCCPLGAIGGLLVGVAIGLLLGQGQRAASVVALAFAGMLLGAAGGYLSPLAVYLLDGMIPIIGSLALAWGIVGVVAGGVAYPIARAINSSREAESDDELNPPRLPSASVSRPALGRGRLSRLGSLCRALPALAVTGYALIAAVLTSSSTTAQILLAIGLLGFAHLIMVVDHDARFNRLERRPH